METETQIDIIQEEQIKERERLIQSTASYLGKLSEGILENIRNDRIQLNDVLTNIVEMVINEGDSSGSTKDAMCNLLKTKSDLADKEIKILDIMMRSYMKETNTFPPYMIKTQQNINVSQPQQLRDIIKAIKKSPEEI